MSTSRSGAGGKIVTNRRKQRFSATPYDRPPPPKSPNWFAGIIVPSARLIASGAGKILNSIFTESEDEYSSSDDDFDRENQYETLFNGLSTINEENVTSSGLMHQGLEPQLNVWSSENKWTIEQLIMQETFSREEYDKLIRILNSRVTKSGEKSLLSGSPVKAFDNEDVDIFNKAVLEAKKWFQEKKVGSSSVAELTHGTNYLNSTGLENVEAGGGSPVDVARSYMKERPPWSSPTRSIELKTPLTTTLKHFKERTLYSVGQDSLSSSKKLNSLVSGSWNIQEELRRVRSKATEDMLRSPSAKIDPSLFAVGPNRVECSGASEVLFGARERVTETESSGKIRPIGALVDAGVSSDPSLTALKSRVDDKASDSLSSKLVTSVSINNEDSEAVRVEGEYDTSEFQHSFSSNHAKGHHSGGPCLSAIDEVLTIETAKVDEKQNVNGLSSSQPSLSAVVTVRQNPDQPDDDNHKTVTVDKGPVNTYMEGNCELLSEAYMEVPIVTESDSIASGSQNSLGVQYEELMVDMTQHPLDEKADIVAGKQQTRQSGRSNRRGRGKR